MAHDSTTLPATNNEATSTNVVALPQRAEPATPSEKAVSFVKRHPVLTIAGGLAIGLAVSSLFPRRIGRKAVRRSLRLAETGAAAALSLGNEALERAEDGGAVARKKARVLAAQAEKIGERAASRAERLSKKAADRAEHLGVAALGTASAWGHRAAERAERISHVAAERAEDLSGWASDRLSQAGDKARVQSSKLLGYPKSSVGDRILDKAHGLKARLRG